MDDLLQLDQTIRMCWPKGRNRFTPLLLRADVKQHSITESTYVALSVHLYSACCILVVIEGTWEDHCEIQARLIFLFAVSPY